ncbi:acyl-homoserine-lactone synthase [Paraherbaspirillum soli]|uniref:Acyl-homoserine-lactone synthase n=1 Tax=Paraherbaspirillum soli TaxID=631222 RepID=A0ABW0M614_9BURK
MNVVSGGTEGLSADLLTKISSYRHKVFVETLGWALETKNGAEQDQFDRVDTVYVVAQDDLGRVNGCARLLPTNRPYLLGEIFPQLLNGLSPPCTPDVWELSRFAAVDFNQQTTSALRQFSSPIAIKLLQESIACAAERGAKQLITVSPIGIERLLRRAGFHARRAGPPMIIDGQPIFACWIDVEMS